ncbi:MAG TPA: DAK2 domain-containing protein [Candidatus Lachnoclostridium pullistercoris]|uniref:DAK2 domain-containing protein n=1 Tax=Candidatus Lachnoclostridium pullistercoris TaxID=2838632 RepID=A0A9D2T6K0_9FIRM|nr:DAK2 domain-containing protein [Candidatus Lachnoclostridium pullistercoris]
MDMKEIDAGLMQKAFLAGAKALEAKKDWINELNVFPVPDGDTGTNMTLTIMAAAKEVAAVDPPTIDQLSKAISTGSLRGARGNSGVILSQLFRGFTKELKGVDVITTAVLASAFARATETAYKAVMKPKEGTILTVAKGMADKAAELAAETDDIIEFVNGVIEQGDYVLSQTPEMLPVLKEAGVVDSGGQGLMEVLKGVRDGLLGKEVEFSEDGDRIMTVAGARSEALAPEADIRFGYCTEFIINLEHPMDEKTEGEFKAYLESIGDSIVVVADEDLVKVHVHTNHPGLAFEKALTYGSLSRMKVDNMREEHHERLIQNAEKLAAEQKKKEEKAQPRKPYGFIAVSMGDGLGEIFRGIGADCLIEGGQTMNPSTEDVLNAVDQVNADVIFILPNNKNIILAAEQAAGLAEGKRLVVIPSKTVPQGITALINFAPDLSVEENEENMIREMNRVKTAQVTYAVRTTTIDGMEISEGDIMAIGDKGMLAVGKSVESTALEALKAMVDEESELVTIYYGAEISEEEGKALKDKAAEAYPGCEVELQRGGQPIYYYLISVE